MKLKGKDKLLAEDGKYYCQCCGGEHDEKDSLLVCIKCFRMFEKEVRVDKLRKAFVALKMAAAEEGIELDDTEHLETMNVVLDENGHYKKIATL